MTVVPPPGADSILSSPPESATRSRIPRSPRRPPHILKLGSHAPEGVHDHAKAGRPDRLRRPLFVGSERARISTEPRRDVEARRPRGDFAITSGYASWDGRT